MNLTPYHAKFFAHELTKRCPSDSIEKLAGALVDAQVDLNPHQIEALMEQAGQPAKPGKNTTVLRHACRGVGSSNGAV